ncbi:MAG: alpha/beta fold hydrolase [Gemmatimonadota bacterium]|nr:MAG: alpha/beta fold hydrolase [Gemmatimonadota bacterium]
MPRVKVNNIQMYYEIHGQGFPLVLIAGYGCGSWLWFKQLPHLSKTFQTIVFDNRGVGKTDKPDDAYSVRMFADDTSGLLKHLNVKKCHILGISMGGMIAQQVALSYPKLVERLILCSTTFGGQNSIPIPEGTLRILASSARLPREEGLRRNMATAFSAEYIRDNPEVFNRVISHLLSNPQPLYANQLQFRALKDFDVEKRLHEISSPVLILAGDRDEVIPTGNSQLLHERIEGSELVVFKGCGHLIIIERAEELNTKITDFLLGSH